MRLFTMLYVKKLTIKYVLALLNVVSVLYIFERVDSLIQHQISCQIWNKHQSWVIVNIGLQKFANTYSKSFLMDQTEPVKYL